MAGFTDFGTFIIMPRAIEKLVAGVGVPFHWRIAVTDDPSGRFWCDEEGRIALRRYGPRFPGDPSVRGLNRARQIIIQARSEYVADKVVRLIRTGALLGYPDLIRSPRVRGAYSISQVDRDIQESDDFASEFKSYDLAQYGCQTAARAWGHQDLLYALEKYQFSLEQDWFTPHSADPIHRQIFPNEYREEVYHVKAAFAIVAAYSVIEELGLEPRSSAKRPRFLPANSNQWNPVVLTDLEDRLRAAGVDPDEMEIWVRRGSPTRVEREMQPKLGTPAKWNRQYGVRDRRVRIPDAIHYASWLRNFIAAHKFRAITSAVSPYDVHNTQGIARRLLLHRLGLWRAFK